MPKVNCAVIGCSNSTYKLKKWRDQPCEKHNQPNKRSCCPPPFRLYCFPSKLKKSLERQKWVNLLKRENRNKTVWDPCESDRICSEHFVDKEPTLANPVPTINLGYELPPTKKPRRTLYRHSATEKPCSSKYFKEETSIDITDEVLDMPPPPDLDDDRLPSSSPSPLLSEAPKLSSPLSALASPTSSEHCYVSAPGQKKCMSCEDKSNFISSLVRKVNSLTLQNQRMIKTQRVKAFTERSADFTWRKIKTDSKMNFYTGIASILAFNAMFELIKPFLGTIRYWRGPKTARRWDKIHRSYRRCTTKILSHKDELLLTLMRLRLGLLNEDLADRFGVSTTVCSNTFATMIRVLAKVLGKALVVWLPREPIREHIPENFKRAGHIKCRVIIDCTEIFIERPKSLLNQAATWSSYKHHNTFKFLIGISRNGYITFVSDCYPGRFSDQQIIRDSGFYDGLEYGDEVMADRGFQIKEDLMLRHASLVVPPGARVKSQMTTKECKKTSKVANLRIHVERAINRIKTFRILKTTLPLTMTSHIDDIILTCAGLCNLKPQLIATKTPKTVKD